MGDHRGSPSAVYFFLSLFVLGKLGTGSVKVLSHFEFLSWSAETLGACSPNPCGDFGRWWRAQFVLEEEKSSF